MEIETRTLLTVPTDGIFITKNSLGIWRVFRKTNKIARAEKEWRVCSLIYSTITGSWNPGIWFYFDDYEQVVYTGVILPKKGI